MSQRSSVNLAFGINRIEPVIGARAFGLISLILVLVLLITNGGAG